MLKILNRFMDYAILTIGAFAMFMEALIGFPSLVLISGVLVFIGVAIGN